MESLFTYLWKSAAIITLFYLFYKFLLQNETHFKSNRYFLFIGVLASLSIPLIIIPRYVEIETIQSIVVDGALNVATVNPSQIINWITILLYGYITISSILLLKLLLQWNF